MNRTVHSVRRLCGVLTFLAAVVGATPAHAGSDERKATAGASELLIPVDPRGTALGATIVGDASGIGALYWNPAGLASLDGTEASFDYTQYFGGIKVNHGAVGTRWGGAGEVAFDARVVSVGEIIETTESAPEGTGKTFNPTFTVLGLSWARPFTDRVRFGINLQYVDERVLDVSARGTAIDAGLQYEPGWRGLRFGMVMKNFGPSMAFSGPGFELALHRSDQDPTATDRVFSTTSQAFELPSYFVIGASLNLYAQGPQHIALKSAFQNNNFVGDNLAGALEWTWRDQYALRGSWFGSFRGTTDITTGAETGGFASGDDLYQGVALGGGANVKAGDSRLGIDVAWRPVRNGFDDVMQFGAHISF